MDEIDKKLLALLQGDATVPVAQLAEQVGLSPTPVWKRIQKMEQGGVITGRVALLDPEQIGVGLIVFVAIEAHEHTPQWLTAFAETVAGMPEVMDAYRMAGEVDYMLRVAVADMTEFDGFYKRLIASVPLKNVTSRFAMERLKQTTAYPLGTRAFRDRRANDSETES
ncbi:MAG: Lrp/AsnC family transcriptional regulator [Acidisphaera sp.]|nr:Lrp/AsnC family transcriptional regulator [Acidisphaera sp.]